MEDRELDKIPDDVLIRNLIRRSDKRRNATLMDVDRVKDVIEYLDRINPAYLDELIKKAKG